MSKPILEIKNLNAGVEGKQILKGISLTISPVPEIRTGLLYGIVLTFARAVGEFGAVLVIGGGVARLSETATIYVFRSLNDRDQVGAYGVSIILAALSIGILIVMDLLRRRSAKRFANRAVAN